MARQGMQQTQKMSQAMVLAPQLRQSLKILQVPAMELRSAILEELESNPTLEELSYDDVSIEAPDHESKVESSVEEGDFELATNEAAADASLESPEVSDLEFKEDFSVLNELGEDWHSYLDEGEASSPWTRDDAEKRQHFFDSLTVAPSFQEMLMEQARMVEDDLEVLEALEFVLGSLDDNGLLTAKAGDLALMAKLPLVQVQRAIKLLRGLEPAGLGAETVQECLLLQLARRGREQSLAARIIRHKWQSLLRRRIPEIARALNVRPSDVEQAIEEISQLDPAPARRYAEDQNRVIEPDVTVEKDEYGEWQIHLNNDYIPRLRISPEYKQLLARGKVNGKDRDYLQAKFRSGRFLINAIEQRQQTIERITRQLLIFQADFFERGRAYLRPLTMSQVAEAVGVHETTVSRAISGKYIRTPMGVFEMKFFFTPGYQGEDGTALSNKSIKDRIARIIESEPPQKPFSDQRIVEILKEEGLTIARRTVAKYREELGILPTNLRRQYA